MNERHVILRASGFMRDAGTGTPFSAAADVATAEMVVEVEDLDHRGVVAAAKKKDVLAVAPVMPLKLIEPVETAAAAPLAGPVEWGVQAVKADTSPFTGDGIVIAVLDTGIDPAHPAFAGVTLVQENFTTDANGNDTHGHGTHCAGTIFGRDLNGTRIGIARGVKKALIGKVLGSQGGPSDQVARAIQWAVQNGANVISMSLGIDFPGYQRLLMDNGLPAELATSRALEGYRQNVQLFDHLAATVKSLSEMLQATIIVAAAGNESRTDENPNFKIAVSPPAVAEGVISVAALGQGAGGLVVAPFSNTGALISGPGVGITSARAGGGTSVKSGTSMATPHVAGIAALWAEKLRAAGPLNVNRLTANLLASGTVAGLAPGFDPNDVGGGLVQAPQ